MKYLLQVILVLFIFSISIAGLYMMYQNILSSSFEDSLSDQKVMVVNMVFSAFIIMLIVLFLFLVKVVLHMFIPKHYMEVFYKIYGVINFVCILAIMVNIIMLLCIPSAINYRIIFNANLEVSTIYFCISLIALFASLVSFVIFSCFCPHCMENKTENTVMVVLEEKIINENQENNDIMVVTPRVSPIPTSSIRSASPTKSASPDRSPVRSASQIRSPQPLL